MAQVIVTESSLENIASAIRGKLNTQDTYKPSEMAGAISQIHGDPVLEALDVRANGTYTPSSGKDGFSQAVVNVPNTYTASDEGKVVSSGALVAQSSQGISSNGTYDTTLKNQVVVNVPNSYSASDEGKVVDNGALVAQSSQTITANGTYDTTLKNQVTVNVSGGGGGGNTTYTGKTDPSPSQGHIGDYYIKYAIFNELSAVIRSYQLEITKGLRGPSILTFVGAQEIQLIFDDGNGNEVNIRTLANFTYSGTTGNGGTTNPSNAFDGNTGGSYWEANPTTVTVYFSATVPTNYTLKKFVVWQRNSSSYTDVWADFDLIETIYTTSRTILSEKDLTAADWAGAGYGTEWDLSDIPNPTVPVILGTYIKVGDTESTAEWAEQTLTVEFDATLTAKTITQNGIYNAEDDDADGYSRVTVNVSGGGEVIPDVPSEYQKVEYVRIGENNIKQYITIPQVSANTQIKAKFRPIAYGEKGILGGHIIGSGNTNNDFELYVDSKNSGPLLWTRTNSIFTYDDVEMKSHTLAIGSGSVNTEYDYNVKFTVLDSYPNTSSATLRVFIGIYSPSNNYDFNGRCYYVSLLNKTSGNYDYFFVPCYRKSDDKVGFYDTVNGVFYPNEGSGEFGKGADV